ncbi:MAG: hypothetical protein DWQ31_03505 [Planctomycetota bacterium]|nr:MAG: hypothetical protein DWQ31_03505 [Planctomycetota bacterium]REJ97676.1 MAG: hypothetical protein DWQ35_01435 [Planctomycetota bacterium]REK23390.1 MAG: hypothetical protein DWQ42_15385 [Planctomycetota bacterium]REK48669.1 MAG: hypothetical protein DWQ46_01945 [Planctomycetota bacterium]
MNREWQTAEDFMNELRADPDYQRRRAEKDRKRRELSALLTEDEKTLVADLAAVGVQVASVWDLVNTSDRYPAAIPVLLQHLKMDHHRRTREGITRALITPDARGVATRQLVRLFQELDDAEVDYKWVLAMAIAETTTKDAIEEVVTLIGERRHGWARGPLLDVLKKVDKDHARPLLTSLRNDPDLKKDANAVLRAIGSTCRRS